MSLRRLVLLLLGAAAAVAALSLRRRTEYVDVEFDDGSSLRFADGTEARDLLDDARAILDAVP